MSAIIDENQSFQDTAGRPLVGGFIYIGDQGLDPVLNPKPIFSDRALTVALANPQTLDSLGKSTNKIWTDGAYSMKIEDVNNVQIYEELDNGEASGIGIIGLTNVIGINAITANASPTITALSDNVTYEFEVVSANTADAVTLNIDGLGAKTINRSFNQSVGIARFLVSQKVKVIYNLGNDNFELENDNRSVVLGVQGADIASAATVDLAAATGNRLDITGSVTIASFGAVLAGTEMKLYFTGAPLLTYHVTQLRLPGLVDMQLAAGSRVVLRSDGGGDWTLLSATGAYNMPQADGTANQGLTTNGAGQTSWETRLSLGTKQVTTSGTEWDFTGIPAGAIRITINFEGVSLSGTDNLLIQLGDAGGFEATGYISTSNNVSSTSNSTTGFIIRVTGAASLYSGRMMLERMDASHLWVSDHGGKISTTEEIGGGGDKTLSAELNQLRITTTGTDTGDAGSVNITYEGF